MEGAAMTIVNNLTSLLREDIFFFISFQACPYTTPTHRYGPHHLTQKPSSELSCPRDPHLFHVNNPLSDKRN